MIKNKVIVWGRDGFNVLGLLRALVGIETFLLVKGDRSYASRSKYCLHSHCVNDDEEGMQYLLSHFSNESHKPIILTSGDDIAIFINNHMEELGKYFILPGTVEKGLQEKYTDKNNMTSLAKRFDILCPTSQYCKWDSTIEDITYPCLIKPAHEKPGHYNEFKFKICKNRSSLEHTLKMVRRDSEFIVQNYIRKEKEVLVYGARMRDGNVVLAGALVKSRFSDSGAGSFALVTKEIPKSIDTKGIASFLQEIDYYGTFSFEYGLLQNKAYFFEVNLRNDGTSGYFHQAGANIPLAYVYSCGGADYTKIQCQVSDDQWFIDELFDFENVLSGKISYKQWKKEKARATIYKYYDKDDEEPWRYLKRKRWVLMSKEMIVKKFRPYIVFVLDKLGIKK